ncbi:MAG: hypothetical protein QM626_12425 [Microbacterium sp.]|uniref:DUF6790 family protein n=1 Tax=Microbacterium sp. TaxID=51671 RepID=UPI0039E3D805
MSETEIGDYIGNSVASCLPLVVAVVGALITVAVRKPTSPGGRLEIWIRWWFGAGMTLLALQVAVYEILLPHQFAAALGYEYSQSEIEEAAANVGWAILGIGAIWLDQRARWLVMIAYGAFLYIDLINHLVNFAQGDAAVGNVGGTWIYDALFPVVGLLLLWAAQRAGRRRSSEALAD